ncbi:hypothetical protein PV326_011217, partial [Microctonus aethiopoides]
MIGSTIKKKDFKLEDSSFQIFQRKIFRSSSSHSMGMEKILRATSIHGSDSLFIQLRFHFLKITVRPFVSEILSFECKRTLFQSITDIDATTGHTANQRAVLKSGQNLQQDALKKVQKSDFFLCLGKSTVSLLILGGMLRFKENSSAECTPNNPAKLQIDRFGGFSGPIVQNLEKIKGTIFRAYLN